MNWHIVGWGLFIGIVLFYSGYVFGHVDGQIQTEKELLDSDEGLDAAEETF